MIIKKNVVQNNAEYFLEFIYLQQADSCYGSENNLRRHGSLLSLASGTSLSQTSASSFKVSSACAVVLVFVHNLPVC